MTNDPVHNSTIHDEACPAECWAQPRSEATHGQTGRMTGGTAQNFHTACVNQDSQSTLINLGIPFELFIVDPMAAMYNFSSVSWSPTW